MTQLWEDWEPAVDLYNCNVPLGFRGPDGNPVQPQCLCTSVDPISYASLYSKLSPASKLAGCVAAGPHTVSVVYALVKEALPTLF